MCEAQCGGGLHAHGGGDGDDGPQEFSIESNVQQCLFSSVVRFRCYTILGSGRIDVLGVRIPCSRNFVFI
jgi:hypothetical protein